MRHAHIAFHFILLPKTYQPQKLVQNPITACSILKHYNPPEMKIRNTTQTCKEHQKEKKTGTEIDRECRESYPRVVMARTFWVVVRGEKSITAYSLASCSFFLSHLSLTTCSSSFCCPCTFASNCTTGLLSKQVAAENQLWTKRRWCMQQQQDRHQNILSQTKRLL